jgi:hypothetical protein
MDKHVSIVKVDNRSYRKIAQENWGLTDEQMRGMHVHHRIKRSTGGTNDPSNLYVCSPSFHRWVWHNGEEFIEWASRAGKSKSSEQQASAGRLGGKLQPLKIKQQNGEKAVLLGTGIHDPEYINSEKYKQDKRRGANAQPLSGKLKGLNQIWMSTVDGFKGNAGNVVKHNKTIGANPNDRIRIK